MRNKLIYWLHENGVEVDLNNVMNYFELSDYGNGITISAWHSNIAQPTQEQLDAIDQVVADRYIDYSQNMEQYVLENQFLNMCDQITGTTSHTKLSFEQLNAIIESMMVTSPDLAVPLSLKLISINSALIRFNIKWWDGCTWHDDI